MDFEGGDVQFILSIRATEEGGFNPAVTTLTINIRDINDNPPECVVKVWTAERSEATTVPDILQVRKLNITI